MMMEFRNLSRSQSLTLMCQLNGKTLRKGIFIARVITPLFTIVSWRAVRRAIFIFICYFHFYQVSSDQLLSRVRLVATSCTTAHQASLSITNSQSLLKLMFIKSVMPSNHLILCHPLLLLPSIFLIIRVFSNESILHIRWPKYWSFSFASVLPMNIQDWLPLGWTGLIS